MKQTNKEATGTSYHSINIEATVNDLTDILGTPICADNDGEDKVNFEWIMETDNGDIFTVYDWKEYRPIQKDEVITWHIGGKSQYATIQAKEEIIAARNKLHMIKTNKIINYGAALTTLFTRLKDAEKTTQSNKQDKYPFAYGKLSMAVKMCLVECSDLDLKEVEKQLYPPKPPEGFDEAPTLLLYDQTHWDENENPNDIPEHLYLSSKA